MGPSLLTAAQLAAWYHRHSGVTPQIPAFDGHPANDVAALAQVFIDDGRNEGVRGDMAFVQSQLETGWMGFAGSQIPPDAYNYAGIYAFDGRTGLAELRARRLRAEPVHGHAAARRARADPAPAQLRRPVGEAPRRVGSSPRRPTAPGDAPLWEYFGGHNCPCGKLIWASADGYGLRIIQMYSQALVESGMAGACVPYAPPRRGREVGHGLLGRHARFDRASVRRREVPRRHAQHRV